MLSKTCFLEIVVDRLRGMLAGFIAGVVFGAIVGLAGFVITFASGLFATTGDSVFVSAFEVVTYLSVAAPFLTVAVCTFIGLYRKWHFFSLGRQL